MKKVFPLLAVFAIVGLFVSACGAPPPLKSDTYLNDASLVAATQDAACTPPCFHTITVGKTTYTDAVTKVKADTAFKDVQTNDNPPQAAWSGANGDVCCQMSADPATGLINALLTKVKPVMTAKQVIDKYGKPDYTSPLDYSPDEVAVALIYTKLGLIAWVSPGKPDSTLSETTPVVAVLYFDPKDAKSIVETGTLNAWNGFQSYVSYKNATPIVTPKVTLTPGSQ